MSKCGARITWKSKVSYWTLLRPKYWAWAGVAVLSATAASATATPRARRPRRGARRAAAPARECPAGADMTARARGTAVGAGAMAELEVCIGPPWCSSGSAASLTCGHDAARQPLRAGRRVPGGSRIVGPALRRPGADPRNGHRAAVGRGPSWVRFVPRATSRRQRSPARRLRPPGRSGSGRAAGHRETGDVPSGGSRQSPAGAGLGGAGRGLRRQDARRLAHLVLDGVHGEAEHVGDLGVGEAVDAVQLEDFATARRERLDGGAERGFDLALDRGGVGGRGAERAGGDVGLGIAADALVADPVQCPVPGGAEQICPERGLNGEVMAAAPEPYEDILGDVLGRSALLDDRFRESDERRVISAENIVERVRGVLSDPGE